MGESNTVVGAYTIYRHLQQYCLDPSIWYLLQFSTLFQLYCGGHCTYPCFCLPGVLLTSTPHNILSKPLASFPHNHSENNEKW